MESHRVLFLALCCFLSTSVIGQVCLRFCLSMIILTSFIVQVTFKNTLQKVMNREHKKVKKWLDTNQLALNIDKTNFIIFHFPQKKLLNRLLLNSQPSQVSCMWLSKWCKIQHFEILFIFNIYSFIFTICLFTFNICLFIFSICLFIFNICLFTFIICVYSVLVYFQVQHLCSLKITFTFNNYIHSKCNIYILFLILSIQRFLSIQQFFIHSRFIAHLSYAWK